LTDTAPELDTAYGIIHVQMTWRKCWVTKNLQTIIKHVAGKQFATDADLKEAVISKPQTLGTDTFYYGLQALAPR
jgi:hypothetical protein